MAKEAADRASWTSSPRCARWRAILPPAGLADDAAVLDFGGETLVLTYDMMVEGVHVLPGQDPADVAWKLVAVNLSDLAAKEEPLGVLLGHTLGEGDERFLEGLAEVLGAYDVPLLGGDTVKGGEGRAWASRLAARRAPPRSLARKRRWVTACTLPESSARRCWGSRRCDGTAGDSSAYRRPTLG